MQFISVFGHVLTSIYLYHDVCGFFIIFRHYRHIVIDTTGIVILKAYYNKIENGYWEYVKY